MARAPYVEGKAPPPVADRPSCPACGKKLRPQVWANYSGGEIRSREWSGRYRGYGYFCSTKCTEFYANALFAKTGVLYVRKEK